MLVVNIFVDEECSFQEGEFEMNLEAVIHDTYRLGSDHDKVYECIQEYDGVIEPGILYTFFLNRANIATAFPGYEPAFSVWQVVENIVAIDIQL